MNEKNYKIRNILFLALGLFLGIITGLGITEIWIIMETFKSSLLTYFICVFIAILIGVMYGSLIILNDVLFPRSKYKILKINPLNDEQLEIIYNWANGMTVSQIEEKYGMHRMQLNRLIRKYLKKTIKPKKLQTSPKREE